jgi:hypothetical protein
MTMRPIVAMLGFAAVTALAELKTETMTTNSTANTQGSIVGNMRPGRILFLGNSITLHGPRPEVGWTNNWGMAASAQEKDYVHVLARSLSALAGAPPVVMIENVSGFERQYGTYDLRPLLQKALAFKPDTVILAIGENVPALATAEARTKFGASVLKLLNGLQEASHPMLVVRSSFWPDGAKDRILKQACADARGVFVDIAALSQDESHYARSERRYANSGVAAHPGDKGMQAIADALLAAMKRAKPATP